MGSYVYKVTSKTVELENGQQANVALYAYKPYWYGGLTECEGKNTQMHVRTGAAACDRNAVNRTGWIVYGDLNDDGTITVEPKAWRIGQHKYGSFNDDQMDYAIEKAQERGDYEEARVTKIGIRLRYSEPPKTSFPEIGLLNKKGRVAWYAICPGDEYVESYDLAEVERHVAGGAFPL